ncbi:MAG: hypothetical protein AAGA73_06660 [Pseudomonadota bacterium]
MIGCIKGLTGRFDVDDDLIDEQRGSKPTSHLKDHVFLCCGNDATIELLNHSGKKDEGFAVHPIPF